MTREERWTLWAQRVAEQQASGASAAAWCAQWEVPVAAFYTWRRRVLGEATAVAPPWAAVDAPATPGLTLRVGALTIEVVPGFDPQLLAAVLAVVTER